MQSTISILCLLTVSASAAFAASSTMKISAAGMTVALPHVSATRFIKSDGTARMYVLFAEKPPVDVVLVDAFGRETTTLGDWTTASDAMAVKLSFDEGDEANYSLNVHVGAESVAVGGHHSSDGIRGVFKKLEIKGDRIKGTVQNDGKPSNIAGIFDTRFTTVKERAAISGAAIAASPQGKALLAYAAAMRKHDFVGASRYSVRDEAAETKRTIGIMGEKGMNGVIKLEFGTAAEFEKLLSTSATMTEDGAKTKIKVTRVDGASSETSTFGLEKIDGVWKVNW